MVPRRNMPVPSRSSSGSVCKDIPGCGQQSCLFCVTDPCNGVDCPSGMQCDSNDGLCHDLCEGVMCVAGTLCFDGICQDCRTLGCLPDHKCVIGSNNIGACEPDLCANVECPADQFCNAVCRTSATRRVPMTSCASTEVASPIRAAARSVRSARSAIPTTACASTIRQLVSRMLELERATRLSSHP